MNNLAFNRRAKWVWKQVNPVRTNQALDKTQRTLIALDKENYDLYAVGWSVLFCGLFGFFGLYAAAVVCGLSAVFFYGSLYKQQLDALNQTQSEMGFLHERKRLYLRFKTLWLIKNDDFLRLQEKNKGEKYRLVVCERRGLFVWKAKHAQNKKHSQKTAKP